MAVNFTAGDLLEACYPLGDQRYGRDVKRRAVRRVMLESWSYLRAAKEAGCCNHAVVQWVGDTEDRVRMAKASALSREPGHVPETAGDSP